MMWIFRKIAEMRTEYYEKFLPGAPRWYKILDIIIPLIILLIIELAKSR